MARLDQRDNLSENVLRFGRPDTAPHGISALKLVYQAAEAFGEMQDRARETEARAKALCASAAERMAFANERAENADRERMKVLAQVDVKLQEASHALHAARLRIAEAEERAAAAEQLAQVAEARADAAELNAQAAEGRAQQAKQDLALVEDAIRRRLLALPGLDAIRAVA